MAGARSLRITTIGDGAMATVCSNILASQGGEALPAREVTMWGRNGERLGPERGRS